MKPRYSGDRSRKFWKRINGIKSRRLWSALYTLGVALQNLEGLVLRELAKAEEDQRG